MEQIYTITINEAFEECSKSDTPVCPFCKIYNKFERDEIDLILGASAMEPSVRLKTNEEGFCKDHAGMMFRAGKKLPFALLLESHIAEVSNKMRVGGLLAVKGAKGSASSLKKVSGSCYVCGRISSNFEKAIDNSLYMWMTDSAFRRLFASQKCFCIDHYAKVLSFAAGKFKSSDFKSYSAAARTVEEKYVAKVHDDLSFFIKKFDYRYENEPWGDAKDAPEKALAALFGKDDV
ncbi:MAG: hypothetical protein IKN38_09580 [Clostridia bacterium]|nr:hypothetical protein [Clostridia bacterium]